MQVLLWARMSALAVEIMTMRKLVTKGEGNDVRHPELEDWL